MAFDKGEPVRYISHLDLMRTWERTLRRAGLHLAHTQGFNPRPRLIFAAPLPVGITSSAELVDVIVEDDLDAAEFRACLAPALPPGLTVNSVEEVPLDTAPLMAMVATSDYVAELGAPITASTLQAFLVSEHVPYQRSRKGGTKQADMRPAVVDLWLADDGRKLGMRLRLDLEGLAVRPDEVLQALGLETVRVRRTALALKERVHAAA
ncbi:MAG TPA: TIGR03936 family radical SAM-associated protein [Chloroflexota bacterium]|nr:TIGR03936 family radical SAM-associated protein [Chloroflexota bacterium]